MKLRKFFLMIFLLSSSLFFVSLAQAAAVPPGKNPMCWTKKGCEAQWRTSFPLSEFNSELNFEMGGPDGVCGSEMGVCIPAGQVSTQIKIGENSQFSNIGDYIKKIYNYLIYIGGTVAVVVLLLGGFFWLTSAGNPGRVTAAKGYISGSLIGLVLLLGSYTLLYTINPDLVRLRLPRVYMVRTIILGPAICSAQAEPVALAGAGKMALTPLEGIKEDAYNIDPLLIKNQIIKDPAYADPEVMDAFLSSAPVSTFSRELKDLSNKLSVCGYLYYLKDGIGQTCYGDFCPPEKKGDKYLPGICVSSGQAASGDEGYFCTSGLIGGTISNSGDSAVFPFIDSRGGIPGMQFFIACNNGNYFKVSQSKVSGINISFGKNFFNIENFEGTKRQIYSLNISGDEIEDMEDECSSQAGVKGYFFAIHAETHKAVQFGGNAVIGKSAVGKCNFLIQKGGPGIILGIEDFKKKLQSTDQANFISAEELKGGVVCDIDVGSFF